MGAFGERTCVNGIRMDTLVSRRAFMGWLAGGLLAPPLAAELYPAAHGRRIGYLSPSSANDLESGWLSQFQLALGRRGYQPGANVVLFPRHADDRLGRLPILATELVDLRVDLMVTFATPASLAAKAARSRLTRLFPRVRPMRYSSER